MTIIFPEKASVLILFCFFGCGVRGHGFVAEWADVYDSGWVYLKIQHA